MLITERNFLSVKVPNELSKQVIQRKYYCGPLTKYQSLQRLDYLARCYAFYLLLKAQSPGAGLIQNYQLQIPALSNQFCISQQSFLSYLDQLKLMKLVHLQHTTKLYILGWDGLGRQLNVNTESKTEFKFYYRADKKITHWFAPLDLLIYKWSNIESAALKA